LVTEGSMQQQRAPIAYSKDVQAQLVRAEGLFFWLYKHYNIKGYQPCDYACPLHTACK